MVVKKIIGHRGDIVHKYLNEIAVKSTDPYIFNSEVVSLCAAEYIKEIIEHGFDSEAWALGYVSATWLYEYLRVYKDWANKVIDLDAIEFDIPILYRIPDDKLEYRAGYSFPVSFLESKIERKTQKETIDIMCRYLKNFLLHKELDADKAVAICDVLSYEYLQGAFSIYAEVISSMWRKVVGYE